MTNQLPPALADFRGCSKIDDYSVLEKLGEGTFGEVHKASYKPTSQLVALKKILLHNEEEGFPITALREIKILKELHHENIIPLLDMSVQKGDRANRKRCTMYMVTPYMDHDLTGLLENPRVRLTLPQIKCYFQQLLQGMNHIHQLKYLHRDIKASNILIDNNGIVKIADFGLARQYLGQRPTEKGGAGPGKHRYTAMVVTRWYRPPELILGEARYTTAIDMWGIGCVFAEMFRRKPILQGHSDTDQGHLIFQLLGSPTQETMPGYDKLPVAEKTTFGPYKRQFEAVYRDLPEEARDLLSSLLRLDAEKRLSALGALAHSFFHTDPPAARPEDLPKYAESHELTARKNRQNKQNNENNNGHSRPHAPNAPHAQNAVYARANELDNFEAGRLDSADGRHGVGRGGRGDRFDNDYDRRNYPNDGARYHINNGHGYGQGYNQGHGHGYGHKPHGYGGYNNNYNNHPNNYNNNNHGNHHNNYNNNYNGHNNYNNPSNQANFNNRGGQPGSYNRGTGFRSYNPPVVPPYRKGNGPYPVHHPQPPPGPPPAPPYRRSQPPPPPPSHPPPPHDLDPPYRRGVRPDEAPAAPPYRQAPGTGPSGLNYDEDNRQ
ncbi:cyclin-dependent serine/threonine protein kinase SGV1 [Sugiyamaella lignohabitans]|uniref:Serine/threonine-protein kinase BUR1 n=1 Tax=Sugiyamaella lignohabitans TaxID=796027 RepID=A0A167DX62_9ASCO|nr:cyclin-dependent serine/threonine protein kinase SGV1 [Sugiyamaella lignohabitans]ANB13402.1 cyclin-dependent serine/threonine protein kinase SGV1 [Sugiyamaella lignohabitans]